MTRVSLEILAGLLNLFQHSCLVLAENTFENKMIGDVIAAEYGFIEIGSTDKYLHFAAELRAIQFFEFRIITFDYFLLVTVKGQHQRRQVMRLNFIYESRRRQCMLLTILLAANAIDPAVDAKVSPLSICARTVSSPLSAPT